MTLPDEIWVDNNRDDGQYYVLMPNGGLPFVDMTGLHKYTRADAAPKVEPDAVKHLRKIIANGNFPTDGQLLAIDPWDIIQFIDTLTPKHAEEVKP